MCNHCGKSKVHITKEVEELSQIGQGKQHPDIEELFERIEKIVKEQSTKHLEKSRELFQLNVVDVDDFEAEKERIESYEEIMNHNMFVLRDKNNGVRELKQATGSLIYILLQLQMMTRN